MSDLPVSYDSSGPAPQTSSDLRALVVANAEALSPGITTELPGSLIEDMVSTAVGALLVCDQARVDLIQGAGALSANEFLLNLLAQQAGVPAIGTQGYTSVQETFSGPPGFNIPQGFIVSDGTYQYVLQDSVIIPASGTTDAVTCIANTSGSWAVPAGSVTNIATSLPNNITLTCNNPTAGTPGSLTETVEQFRSRVWDAGMVTTEGSPAFIRTTLSKVANVVSRLVSVVQSGSNWIIMCGGGDVYSMAGAIQKSAGDISRLSGCTLNVTGITQANPGVATTEITHGFSSGQVIQISGIVGMTALNGVDLTITVIDAHTFSIGVDTSAMPAWISGGVVTPNLRNNSITVNDWPDNYVIPFVIPLQQLVTVNFAWATSGNNYLANSTVQQLISANVISYINSIYAGKPLSLIKLRNIFEESISSTLDISLLSKLTITVTVNDVITSPDTGTDIISGDPYSYWYVESTGITTSEG
ncbi:ubiquitin-activating E1 FCCH domain-containing protein [Mangrovibacter phragmitis]|uniref:ubiquitin-activating E1 FCCH domain-containing protein n=1 Tax=Mangrovibacter phragmitis TaxID=1691903 RepID=UPI003369D8F8